VRRSEGDPEEDSVEEDEAYDVGVVPLTTHEEGTEHESEEDREAAPLPAGGGRKVGAVVAGRRRFFLGIG
jgi:hypothetical protein